MTEFVNMSIIGLKEINDNLNKLKGRTANNIMSSGTRAAAVVFMKEAKNNLPAAHKKKIGITKRRTKTKTEHRFSVGPYKKNWQLSFLEFGVRPHDITPKRKKVLVDLIGGDLISKKVHHPGVTKLAFLRKAFTKTAEAQAAFRDKIWDRIKKELK